MRLASLRGFALAIPFTAAFKHASAERAATQSLWVEARSHSGAIGFGEGCPRDYVTGESLDSGREFIAAHRRDWLATIHDLGALVEWSARHRGEIDANPAAWTAVELALLDLLGRETRQSVESLLGLAELSGSFRYTAVLGDASAARFEAQVAKYVQTGFLDFKIKLSVDLARDREKVRLLSAAGVSADRVRADANNLWIDPAAAIRHLRDLDFPFCAVEEPLRAGDYVGMRRIAAALDTAIVLDESLVRAAQLEQLAESAERWIVNLRVSKMGGLLRSLEFLDQARRQEVRVIIGAHVGETSLLSRAALTVANSARDILIGQEGAFGNHLLTEDIVYPPIMFGAGGLLDVARQKIIPGDGFGVAIAQPVPYVTPLDGAAAG